MSLEQTLSFKDWVRQNPSIPINQRNDFYQAYLRSKQEETTSDSVVADDVRASYIAFLKRLTVFYEDDPEVKQLKNLDFDDELQLRAAMPIFARKLKDIALFANHKRKELKRKKIELSSKGSKIGLDSCLRTYLIENYSKSADYINPLISDLDLFNQLLDSKELQEQLRIECVEKYNIC